MRGGIAAERRILRLVRQGSWRFVDKLIPISEFPLSTLSRPVLRVLPDKSVMGQVVSRSPFAIDDTGAEALDRFTPISIPADVPSLRNVSRVPASWIACCGDVDGRIKSGRDGRPELQKGFRPFA